MAITRPNIAQLAGVPERLERSSLPSLVHQREVVAEIPFWDEHTTALETLHGTSAYPQAIAFDDVTHELFVQRRSGGNAYIWVYEVVEGSVDWPLKRCFTTGQPWSECLVIRYVGGTRWLYSMPDGGAVYRANISTLPENLATVSTVETFPNVVGYTMMTFDGNTFAVQSHKPEQGRARRYRFDLWSADLTTKIGQTDFTYAVLGDVGSYLSLLPKAQSICSHEGRYVFSAGGVYLNNGSYDTDSPSLHPGIVVCSADGSILTEGYCRPDDFMSIISTGMSYAGNMIENEGLALYQGDVHALWMCQSPLSAKTAGDGTNGFVITREMSTNHNALDFRPAARVIPTWDPERYGVRLIGVATVPINPVTGVGMDSFGAICSFMKEGSMDRYTFYGADPIDDISGTPVVVQSCFVTFLNANGSTFLVTIDSLTPGNRRKFWIYNNFTQQTDIT